MAKYVVSRSDGTPVPEDEPCFVIRAQDMFSAKIVQMYIGLVEHLVDDDMVEELVAHFMRIKEWQRENKDKIKIPD